MRLKILLHMYELLEMRAAWQLCTDSMLQQLRIIVSNESLHAEASQQEGPVDRAHAEG
jgi:hypothetical protein